MSIPVAITVIIGIGINKILTSSSIIILFLKIVLYTILYGIFMWILGMNEYEKSIVLKPLNNIMSKIRGETYDRNTR